MPRAVRITLWSLGTLLALMLLALAALLLLGNTGRGREFLAKETAALTRGHVRFSGLAGSFPAAIFVAHLELADAHGVWLKADRISLRWSPLALLARRIEATSLEVAHLDIERAPVKDPQSSASSSMPHIDIGHFAVGTLELGAQLTRLRALLSVSGSARLRSLQDADASLSAHRIDGAAGDYALRLHMDPQSMQAQLRLSEPGGGTLESLLGIPGLGDLNVSGNLTGPRGAERVELAASAGELRAGVNGVLDLTVLSADLTWHLDAPAMTLRPGLTWQKVAVSGNWRGPLKAAQAQARVQIDALQAAGAQVAHVDGELRTEGGNLRTHIRSAGIVLPGPAPQLLAAGALIAEASMRLDDESHRVELKASHPLFALSATVAPEAPQRVDFALRLTELAPLLRALGQDLHGRSELKGHLQQNASELRLELTADSDIAPQATPLGQLVSGPSHLQLTGSVSPATLEVGSLRFSARNLTSSASARARRGDATEPAVRSLEARLEAALPNLGALAPSLGGTLQLKGSLSGPPDSLSAQLQLNSSLAVRGAKPESIQASIKARGVPTHLNAVVQARGSLLGAPLDLDAAVERSTEAGLHLHVQRATWRSAQAFADVWTAANFDPQRGNAQLRIERLADLAPLLGTAMAGRVSAEASLRPAREGASARLKLDGEDLEVAGVPLSAQLRADGPLNALELHLAGQSANLAGEPASLEAHAHLRLDDRLLTVRHLNARYHEQTLRLLQPANLSFGDGLTLSAAKLGVQHAVLEVDGRITPAPDLKARLQGVDAALVNAFAPQLLASGRFGVQLQMRGSFQAPTGSLELQAQGVRLAGSTTRNLQALDARASAQLNGANAQVDARLDAGSTSHLTLGGKAPLAAGGSLDLQVAGALDAALANPLLEARGERATGTLTVNASVTGALRDPQIGGTLDLAHGDLRDYTQGLHLSAISAHLVGEAGALRIESLVARASPGQVSMTGTIGILQPKIPVTLQLTANNAQPITSDLLTTNLDASLKLSGNLSERCELAGVIHLHRTLIGIPNALPPDVAVLDVRRPGQAPPPANDKRLVIGLDLQLDAPREILVQGRGLNAEMGGDLHVRGTSASPRVSGSFDMIRGVFSLASTQLNFTDGRVSFNGAGLSERIDPSLDFNAQATAAGATVTLHIGGLATAPTFTLSSSPTLPEDEILARLLFGESASQLTGLQVAQIGVALASLSGVGGSGPNPLAKIQKALGLDRLSLGSGTTNPTTGQSTGAAVEAGRYVNSRVFVGAKQSTTGYSQVEVDVDLTKHLKLQTRLGNGTAIQGTTPDNDPGSTIGFVYQLEY